MKRAKSSCFHYLRRLTRSVFLFSFFMILIFLSTHAVANVNGDLGNFFANLGYEGNVTRGHAYQGQEAGYYSGGSLFLRNQVKDIQVMHVDLPSYRAGCGGIDLFVGGFSFVNTDGITKFFQQIMSDATGYAFQLALETATPEMAHVVQYIQDIAQKMNNSNLSSCEMSEDLVGGLWPRVRATQQHICQDIGSQNGYFHDWAAARQGCGVGTDFDKTIKEAESDSRYKQLVVDHKNLVWDAILANGFLQSDKDLAMFFMSLSGTIIFNTNKDGTHYVATYPSLASNRNLLNALLHGGTSSIYHCDDDKCLNVSRQDVRVDDNNNLIAQVNTLIGQLTEKVRDEGEMGGTLTDKEKGFLNSISIPILKFITVMLSLNPDATAIDLTQYSELIAQDLLEQYLQEILHITRQSLSTTQYTPELRQQLETQIQQALQVVHQMELKTHAQTQDLVELTKKVQFIEQQVTSHLVGTLKDNVNFGAG